MMPQLGVLSTFHEKAALEVFHKDCLIKLGTCVAPLGQYKIDQDLLTYEIMADEKKYEGNLKYGELLLLSIPKGEYDCLIQPNGNVDLGFGKGNEFKGTIYGGEVGIVLDGRGREIYFSNNASERISQILKWSHQTNEYDKEELNV